MSRTYRKDRHIKFQEGNPKKLDISYRCRCSWCTTDKKDTQEKMHKKIMKNQLFEWNKSSF